MQLMWQMLKTMRQKEKRIKKKKHNGSCFQSKHRFIPYNRLKQKVVNSSNKIKLKLKRKLVKARVNKITEMLLGAHN